MFGHIHLCLKEFIREKYGESKFKEFVHAADANIYDDFMLFHCYEDEKTMKMFEIAANIVEKTLEQFLEEYGCFFYHYAASKGYDRMISVLGSTFEVFVQNLDHLHSILATTYKGMRPPSFRFETSGERLLIHIMTQRKGTYPIAIGLLKESAQQLFKTEIFLTVVDTNGPITDERYIDHVIAEVKVLSKHKSRRVTQGSRTDSGRQGSRKKFRIGREQFQHLMPYGISFDSKLQIRTAGINIMTLCPHILDKSLKMNDVFQLVEPKIDFSYDKMIKSKINSFYLKFVLSGRDDDGYQDEKERAIVLKGPLLHIEEDRELIFLGSPHFDSLADFSASSTLLSVIPTEALSIEILFMYNQRKADMEMSKKLDITTAKLQKLAISLEEEKKKTDSLLYQMLPYKVANQLRDGKPVEAENHEAVTILFSDIVSFTMMASKTEPMGTVNVLNQLFHKFDTLSIRHGVYKVETIGDAYMVVSGVPEVDEEHAQKLSNMAVDMMEESRTVLNPYTKCPLQIRIGLHSGPVVTGVVGIKMPRFCLFGDTVNTASRMESSGLPGKIHISDATYENLKDSDNFILQPRGYIHVKGKGRMMTYFITGNNGAVIPGLIVDATSHVCDIM